MLAQLEATARARGATACTLMSTGTARRFYLSAGYVDQGVQQSRFGAHAAYRMTKPLI
jgi:hypothetical protein